MSATAILGENVSKSYVIGRERSNDTLRDAIAQSAAASLRRVRAPIRGDGASTRRERQTIWALRDVSFEIRAGDVLGIVGRNGAGKSTLLKILSRITEPTGGRIGINGRVGSLLEVGTGFHQELTGRENVFLYGSILGMRRTEIQRRFDQIVDFADIGVFLDTPVKRYSSGMQVRLAFAVAAHLEPDILLVDEVLAVGDVAFQKKCLGRMGEAASEGRTVVFVSHNMAVMKALCRRGIFIDHGQVAFDGPIDQAISSYLRGLERVMTVRVGERKDRSGWDMVRLEEVRIRGGGEDGEVLSTGSPATFVFELDRPYPSTTCDFTIHDDLGHPVAEFRSSNASPEDIVEAEAPTRFICAIAELPLLPGRYRIDAAVWAQGHLQDALQSAAIFDVEQGLVDGRPVSADSGTGNVAIRHRWTSAASDLSW